MTSSQNHTSPLSWDEALQAWSTSIGQENVDTSTETLRRVETATFPTKQSIPAVLRPASRLEVQRCVEIANQAQTPLYPISQGKNWGLGSRVPTADHCVLLDLGRMNRIVDFNEELGYITVEPGVTFQNVHDFLQERSSKLFVSVIGGSPHASLIGNALERGDGIGPYGERQAHTCALEVVLPTGAHITTGMGQFEQSNTEPLYQWGLGPSLDGLFTQSNLGIVTQMTIWLMPKPGALHMFFATLADLKQLEGALREARTLIQSQVIAPNCLNIWNGYKLIAKQQQYPFEALEGKTPLPPDAISGEPWYISGAIYAHNAHHAHVLAEILERTWLPHTESIHFFDTQNHPELLEDNAFLGIPSDANMISTYWRKRTSTPEQLDPDRDRCGVSWLCPILPFEPRAITKAISIAESTMLEHGFEPNLGMSCPSGRCLRMFIAMTYDRDVEGEDQRAQNCHDALFTQLNQAGFLPYRLGIQSMPQTPERTPEYAAVLQQLKTSFDPNGILAPGRYIDSPKST